MPDDLKQPYTIVPVTEVALDHSREGTKPTETVIEAEWVRRYPARRRGQLLRWLGLLFRIVIALGLTGLFYVIPPTAFPDPFQNWKNPILIFLLICFIGKTLLDTFFYDHYQP